MKRRKAGILGTFLAVQWLRHCSFNSCCMVSVPGQGTKIPYAVGPKGKKIRKAAWRFVH